MSLGQPSSGGGRWCSGNSWAQLPPKDTAPGTPGTQGQTPFIPRTGPTPAGQAKGRCVLGAGWPPAQPDKAVAGEQNSKPKEHGPPLCSCRPELGTVCGAGWRAGPGVVGGGDGEVTRASGARGCGFHPRLLRSQHWDPGTWCSLSRNPAHRPPQATGNCPPSPRPASQVLGPGHHPSPARIPTSNPPCPSDLQPWVGVAAAGSGLSGSLAPSCHTPTLTPRALYASIGKWGEVSGCSCVVVMCVGGRGEGWAAR